LLGKANCSFAAKEREKYKGIAGEQFEFQLGPDLIDEECGTIFSRENAHARAGLDYRHIDLFHSAKRVSDIKKRIWLI